MDPNVLSQMRVFSNSISGISRSKSTNMGNAVSILEEGRFDASWAKPMLQFALEAGFGRG